jgi:hypothetical protein
MSERRRLINLAYWLLGSLAEAKDVVQETYARWYAMSEGLQSGPDATRASSGPGRVAELNNRAARGSTTLIQDSSLLHLPDPSKGVVNCAPIRVRRPLGG